MSQKELEKIMEMKKEINEWRGIMKTCRRTIYKKTLSRDIVFVVYIPLLFFALSYFDFDKSDMYKAIIFIAFAAIVAITMVCYFDSTIHSCEECLTEYQQKIEDIGRFE